MVLDAVDNAIIGLLTQDGRMSNREIGRALSISEGMVRQRLKKLTDKKAMRLGMVRDISAAGMHAAAVVRIKTLPDHVRDNAAVLSRLDSCKFVGLTLGQFDIVVYIVAASRADIAAILNDVVAKLPGIDAVDVREPVGAVKQRYDLTFIL